MLEECKVSKKKMEWKSLGRGGCERLMVLDGIVKWESIFCHWFDFNLKKKKVYVVWKIFMLSPLNLPLFFFWVISININEDKEYSIECVASYFKVLYDEDFSFRGYGYKK